MDSPSGPTNQEEAGLSPTIPKSRDLVKARSMSICFFEKRRRNEQKKKTLTYGDYIPVLPYDSGGIKLDSFYGSPVDIEATLGGEGENQPRFEDIHAVYADGTQLIKSTVASGEIFPNTFYKDNNNLGFNTEPLPKEITIVYFVKPALIEVTETDEINDVHVMIPREFIELAKAKLRGEAYKLANENDYAGVWLNDYNILLETFKAWVAQKTSNFGI